MKDNLTVEYYRKFIQVAKKQYKFISYEEIKTIEENYILWRHDVDFSPHRAYSLAKIEYNEKVKATYFIQLNSEFYNVFEKNIKEKFIEIRNLGHDLALHFDPTNYEIFNLEDLEKYITFEKEILNNFFNINIKVVSFHIPTKEILELGRFQIAGLINTYSKYLKENTFYCSDSLGFWKYHNLEDVLQDNHPNLHILTHPEWWTKEEMLPREKIQRAIDGRASYCSQYYDDLIDGLGRENIGKK